MRPSTLVIFLMAFFFIGFSPPALFAQPPDQKKMTITPDTPIPFPSTDQTSSPTGYSSAGLSSGVHFGQDIRLEANQTVDQVQLVMGSAIIDGHVRGDILIFGGNLTITETAQVEGQTQVYLGQISGEKNLITGTFQETNGFKLVLNAIKFIQQPERVWFGGSNPSVSWSFASISVMFIVYLLITSLLPTQIMTMESAISQRIIGSTMIGLFIFLLLIGLFWFAVFSIIGIPLLILLFSLLVPMAIYGKTAVFTSLGYSVLPKEKSALWAVILGYILYQLALQIWPLISLPTFVLVSALGVSATIRTAFGSKLPGSRSSRPTPQNYNHQSRNQTF